MPVIGNPINPSTDLSSLATRTVESSKIYGEQILSRRRAVKIHQGGSNKVFLVALTEDKLPITPSVDTVKIRFSEAILHDIKLAETTADSVDYTTSEIQFTVPSVVQSTPGIYVAAMGFFQETSLLHVENSYIYVEPSVWGNEVGRSALPLIDELRMSLRDSDIIENEILGDRQFGLEEICFAAIQTIRLWNDTPPQLGAYTTITFKYPHILKRGIHLFLFDILLEWFRKNRLPYNAGGVQIDDMGKLNEYIQIFQLRFQETIQLMQRAKSAENLRRGFAKIG